MLAFLRNIIRNRNLGGEKSGTATTFTEEPVEVKSREEQVGTEKIQSVQVTSFNMNGECAVCLNSVMEAAPAPPSEAASNGAIAEVTAAPPRKRAKKNAAPKLEESRSLDDTFVTPCGHLFHAQCLKQWYAEDGKGSGNSQKASCPNCRKPVTKASLIQVFIGGGAQALQGPSPRSSNGPSTSTVPSQLSSNAASTSSGPSMTSTPARSGNRKRQAPETVVLDGPVAYNGNDINELREVHNYLIHDYNVLQQRFDALEEERDILKAQFLSVQPNEVVVVNGNANGNETNDNPTGAGVSGQQNAAVAPKRQTAFRGRRRSVRFR